MKRVERKQLKEDEFVSGINTVLQFLKARQKEFIMVAAGLAAVVLIVLGLTALRNRNLRKESRVVSEIVALRAEIAKKPENLAKLEKLAGNGKFQRMAYIELATYWLEKGDIDKAEQQARQVKSTPKDFLYYGAQDLLGQIAVKKKDFAAALEIFRKIEEAKPSVYPMDAILFHKGEALELKGDRQGALAVFKQLQDEYAQSYYGYEAALKASRLGGAK